MLTVFCAWLCLSMSACGVSSSPAMPRIEARAALMDDVNVLMYGVLQFSETLHHAYQNTEAKLARVTRSITNTESVVQRLGQDTEQTISSERQIKDRLDVIQVETEALQVQTQRTRGLVYKEEQEDAALKRKLTSLETTLKRFTPHRIRALKEITQRHNVLLHDLVSWTEKQRQQLENQNQQLDELQKRTGRSVRASTSST